MMHSRMAFALKIIGLQTSSRCVSCRESGRYVTAYDPDAAVGFGVFKSSRVLAEAVQFATPEMAVAYWQQQSTLMPYRDDGLANRPLTAFTVEIVPLIANPPSPFETPDFPREWTKDAGAG